MSLPSADEYVSVIGTSFLYPLSTLLESLESSRARGPSEVQASPLENGYSAAVIVLTVLMVESAIARTQFIQGTNPPKRPIAFIRASRPLSNLADVVEELFVVRDVVAHNHIWDARIAYAPDGSMKLVSATRDPAYGDAKFARVIDPSSRKTKKLGINLFPTRIGREDAIIVLKNAKDFLLLLEAQDRRYFYLSPQPVEFKGVAVRFVDLVDGLQR
ncbi:MAG: hypothetical protein ABIJ00_02545 [Candidatus Eisenbacteria bacterium]